jgi:two-component system, cell cycle sensor histidine kinase and response regulator CckA
MLTAAILALTSRTGIMEPIAHEGFAGRSARMLMPVVLVGPLTFGWLRIQGEQMGLYPSETGVALTITVIVLTLAIFVWWNARTLLDLDRQRVAAEVALRETNEHLERRVAERTIEIERRRQFLDAVLSGMQDALIVNKSGRIAYANEAGVRLFGADSETGLIGRSPLTLIHPDDHPAVLARIKDLTAQPTQVPTIEERIVRLDGKTVDVEVTAASFFDGAEPAIVAMFRDITERKSMERLLQRSQRLDAIGQLTGGIAHDFNNLLCVVISNLDLLEEDLKNDPAARELSDAALKAALRGAELTRQLLAFSRKQTLAPRAIELNALVDETATLLRRTLGEAIEVRINATEGLWPAIADPTQVESALMNLAINARDAMPEGGSITIETANKHLDETYAAEHTDVTAGDYVMLAVSDTGSGIPHEMLEKVFEPFFTTKADGKGSGLGLSMVYGFAKQSRGHVKIYSEMGHGTTVRLYLPRSTEAATAPESRPASVNDDFNGATILVVEDNPDVRDAVVRQLTQAGYAVLQAENAATALELLCHSRHVDLLFSDVVMGGGMTGIDLAAEAKKCRPDLSILLTSGFAEAALNRSSGGVEFPLLSKPYRKQDLLHRVNELLSARSPRVGRNLSQSGSRQ